MKKLFLVAVFTICGCYDPHDPNLPKEEPVIPPHHYTSAPTAERCKAACTNIETLKCTGFTTRKGAGCFDICSTMEDNGISFFTTCRSNGKTCEEVKGCVKLLKFSLHSTAIEVPLKMADPSSVLSWADAVSKGGSALAVVILGFVVWTLWKKNESDRKERDTLIETHQKRVDELNEKRINDANVMYVKQTDLNERQFKAIEALSDVAKSLEGKGRLR